MTIHPSLVVGVGTSGALVTSNIERILYEVLGDTPLDLLKLLVVETDNTPRETEVAPGGRISQMVDAFEPDIGKAIRDLNAFLKTDFDWCPKGPRPRRRPWRGQRPRRRASHVPQPLS